MSLILPQNYDPHMTVRDTQDAIKFIRDNHVYIMLNGKVYNVTGQAVELK